MKSSEAVWRVQRPGHRVPADRDPMSQLLWWAPFSVRTDEVVTGWQQESWRGLARVSGPWAVALDNPASDATVIAHDPVGQMTVFWTVTTTGDVLVSAHLGSLADHPEVDDSLDPEGVAMRYALGTGGWDALRRTDFRHIHELPFGHALVVTRGGQVSEHQFWNPYDVGPQDQSLSPQDCVMALQDELDDALRRSLVGLAGRQVATAWTQRIGLPVRLDQLAGESGGRVAASYGARWSAAPEELPFAVIAAEAAVQSRTRFNELDHHRYPKRGADVLVSALPDAREAGAAAWFGFDELGVFRLHMRPADGSIPRRPPWVQRTRHALGSVAATRPVARTAGLLLPPRSEASRRIRRRETSRHIEREFPSVVAAQREQSRRMREAATSQQLQAAVLMSTETRRHHEATTAIAGAIGVPVRAPLMDVRLVERALTLPDHAWQSQGCTDWVFRRVLDSWWPEPESDPRTLRSLPGVALTPESLLPERVWTENHPVIRDVWRLLGGRVLRTGQFRDPRDW